MAFYEWDTDGTNLSSNFSGNENRIGGFAPGTGAEAPILNSILNQNSLIACALMDSLGISALDTRANMKTAIDTALGNLSVASATNATYATYAKAGDTQTIDQRLTSLGFKKATVSSTLFSGYLIRQGNLVISSMNDVADASSTILRPFLKVNGGVYTTAAMNNYMAWIDNNDFKGSCWTNFGLNCGYKVSGDSTTYSGIIFGMILIDYDSNEQKTFITFSAPYVMHNGSMVTPVQFTISDAYCALCYRVN